MEEGKITENQTNNLKKEIKNLLRGYSKKPYNYISLKICEYAMYNGNQSISMNEMTEKFLEEFGENPNKFLRTNGYTFQNEATFKSNIKAYIHKNTAYFEFNTIYDETKNEEDTIFSLKINNLSHKYILDLLKKKTKIINTAPTKTNTFINKKRKYNDYNSKKKNQTAIKISTFNDKESSDIIEWEKNFIFPDSIESDININPNKSNIIQKENMNNLLINNGDKQLISRFSTKSDIKINELINTFQNDAKKINDAINTLYNFKEDIHNLDFVFYKFENLKNQIKSVYQDITDQFELVEKYRINIIDNDNKESIDNGNITISSQKNFDKGQFQFKIINKILKFKEQVKELKLFFDDSIKYHEILKKI